MIASTSLSNVELRFSYEFSTPPLILVGTTMGFAIFAAVPQQQPPLQIGPQDKITCCHSG